MTGPADPGLRVPPHSVVAEQSVLGGLLIDNTAWEQARDQLTTGDFFRREHQAIWHAMASLLAKGQPAAPITVFDALQSVGRAD